MGSDRLGRGRSVLHRSLGWTLARVCLNILPKGSEEQDEEASENWSRRHHQVYGQDERWDETGSGEEKEIIHQFKDRELHAERKNEERLRLHFVDPTCS